MMSHLRLLLFGGFSVTLDGEPITAFGSDKTRALLAYLAIESGRPHRRDKLAAMLWPEALARKAAHSLSQTLLRLRRALCEDQAAASAASQPFLLANSQTLQFNPLSDHWLDVADFAALIQAHRRHHRGEDRICTICAGWLCKAADLYRGDLLDGFSLRDSVPFEEWQLLQQEALHIQALEALGILVAYHQRLGEPARVGEYARRLVALDPWHDQANVALMAALVQCGQEVAALQQYEAYRQSLQREFSTAPSTAATTLYGQLRARQGASAGQIEVASARPAGRSQRRQVSVLVCRMTVADRTDPEELHQRLARYDALCAPILERYEGQQQPRQGTQWLVYFGHPLAHEDSARRAAHAALAMVAAAQPDDSVRIGIHTGMMAEVGGELVGDVPDVARKCQRLAEPNSVWVTADCERLLQGWFDCQATGFQFLSDSASAALYFRLADEHSTQNRLAWLARTQRLARLAGREGEMQQLVAGLERARDREGRVITLRGDAGIGKSRLLWETRRQVSWPFRWLESRCLPHFQNTSLHPLIGLLEQLLEFAPEDEPQQRRVKLQRTLARLGLAQPATAWLLALLLGLPSDTPAPQTITDDLRERMRAAFLALLSRCATEQPLALVIEDLHWADPSTVAWLDASLDALESAGCLLLLTYRPTFRPSWRPRRLPLHLDLGPLTAPQVESMVADLAGDAALSGDVRARILAQSDGYPLFVEELTRSWREAGSAGHGNEIPTTLCDFLLARLDRAGAARTTAGWAAVLGREFDYPVLAAAVPYSEARLQADLATLVEADLLRPSGSPAQAQYAFRHALIQEAAYTALLKHDRQSYHRRVAETFAAHFPRIAATQPELLAEHFSQAGQPDQAADHWLRAAERASAQGAAQEAAIFLERADALIAPEDHERRWRSLAGRESHQFMSGARAAQQASIAAMLAHAQASNNQRWLAEALQRRLRYLNAVGDYPAMLALADDAVAAARAATDPGLEARALGSKAAALTRLDDPAARQTAQEALARARAAGDQWAVAYALGMVALHEAYAGDYGNTAQLWERVLALVRQGGDRGLEARALSNLGAAYQYLGLFDQAQTHLEAGSALCELIGDAHGHAYNVVNLGGVMLLRGELAAAKSLFEQGLREATAVDDICLRAGELWELGRLAVDRRDYLEATRRLAEAKQLYEELAMNARVVETDALLAQCALGQGRVEDARREASQVWRSVQTQGTGAMDEATSTLLTLAELFQALDDPATVRAIVEAGYALVMARADKISDPQWRRSFLENVPSNRALVEWWRQMQRAEDFAG